MGFAGLVSGIRGIGALCTPALAAFLWEEGPPMTTLGAVDPSTGAWHISTAVVKPLEAAPPVECFATRLQDGCRILRQGEERNLLKKASTESRAF